MTNMASSPARVIPILLFVLVVWPPPDASPCYKRLFSLGDSITDAGNLASVAPNTSVLAFPYGETFFHHPTGRFCDGRLIALKLPLLTPFLVGKTAADFRQGANFAVSGATALSQQFFKDMGLDLTILPPFSLDVQLEWLKQVIHLLGPTEKERHDIMSTSLFLLGEIGINDYNHPFFQNRSFTNEIKPLVPKVIKKIKNATKVVLIGLGAKTIVVPGSVPMGCIPRYLTMFQSNNAGDYDAAGCLRWLNDFAEEHNRELRLMLEQVPRDPEVTVVYADYYGAILEITRFRKDVALTACCGDGGPHNSGELISCNATSVLCPDPSEHISWDGVHLTEAAYEFVARGVLHGNYAAPQSVKDAYNIGSMAASAVLPLVSLLLVLLVCPYSTAASAASNGTSCYTHLFSLGDSISDPGNFITFLPQAPAAALPYGETFFHRPTGRFCDGRLIVDFIAEALGLPFAPPFLVGGGNRTAEEFRQGANFAVGGATALDKDFLREMGLSPALVSFIPPYPLDVQMEQFKQVLHSLGHTEQERRDIMSTSLFVLGEIGDNDYTYFILENRSIDAVIKPLVIPKVVAKIENAIKVLIELGAKTIVVPGDFMMGCLPRFLTIFQSSNPDDYDGSGCIRRLNELIQQHNLAVRAMVERIRRRRDDPAVTIIYVDLSGAAHEMIHNPLKHGRMPWNGTLVACCGDGGPYNSNSFVSCNATSGLCPDASKHIPRDGDHLTEAANRFVARGILHGPYAAPPILSTCKC
ncbi:hypothetical protein HU200_018051 [Digitaria exilis]|uniref:GDSL esterase/lipase n=1 Tax=Digitaria exilis TaxID=1010633 RepID=A0A835F582_9POAL|nr:hypothetical protein HU200_018051 [Digitaria exilis]